MQNKIDEIIQNKIDEISSIFSMSKIENSIGYMLSKDGGQNWIISLIWLINTSDTLYLLPITSGAKGMWLSSTSIWSDLLIDVRDSYGRIGDCADDFSETGFCPIVCLNSNVSLTKNDDGSVTIN